MLTYEIEAEDGEGGGAKQREHTVKGFEQGIEERVQRRGQENVKDDLQEPCNAENGGYNAQHEA